MSAPDLRSLPTLSQLWKATGIAVFVAFVILIIAVLPVEYGIDPTGIGKKLGLVKMAAARVATPLPLASNSPTPVTVTPGNGAPSAPAQTVMQRALPFRSDEMSLTLKPGEGAEIKAVMLKGDQFVFGWIAENGKVEFDMHGEVTNARNDEFTSYWKETDRADGHGTFTAPFDGTHGWFWRNNGNVSVTVRVKVSGFYEKLYRPM